MPSSPEIHDPNNTNEEAASSQSLPFENRKSIDQLSIHDERERESPKLSFDRTLEEKSEIVLDTIPQNVPLPIPTTTTYSSHQSSLYGVSEQSTFGASLKNNQRTNQASLFDTSAASITLPTPAVTPYNSSQVSFHDVPNSAERGNSLDILERSINDNTRPLARKHHANAISWQNLAVQDEIRNSSKSSSLSTNGSCTSVRSNKHGVKNPLSPPLPPLLPSPSKSVVTTYRETVKRLSKHLPHLNSTLRPTRFRTAKLTTYDYFNNRLISDPSNVNIDLRSTSDDISNRLKRSLKETPDEVNLRLIVVEDLSPELIEILGSVFGMSPEFFEEHLLNSGWQNGEDQDGGADLWNTRSMKKDYVSVRWYRPGLQTSPRLSSVDDRISLLGQSSLEWTEIVAVERANGNLIKRGVHHTVKPATNILRRAWNLKTKPPEIDSTLGSVAWEERATLWSKTVEDCLFGVWHLVFQNPNCSRFSSALVSNKN